MSERGIGEIEVIDISLFRAAEKEVAIDGGSGLSPVSSSNE